ncbi:hypothetical protein SAMN05720761_1467 [Fibrobacter sp. UWCM]|uniref:hypothetical protein n=1 Tax=Fibrobacter sp. UWCM TaxID=1896208 RepID=UPI00091E24FA|nr:hypothetical protein [Fibrobacter sp. UWCM]SHH92433.1 hypothetical protein SAMN05720761_1467 [Fibrobacter sp. UWCM]
MTPRKKTDMKVKTKMARKMKGLKPKDMRIDPSMWPLVLQSLFSAGEVAIASVNLPIAIFAAFFGGVIAELKQQSFQQTIDRLDDCYKELVSKDLISKEFLESDDYANLMIDIIKRINSFNREEKRVAVVQIYKQVVQNQLAYDDSNEKIFIDILGNISTQEILVLNFVEMNAKELETIDTWWNFYDLFAQQNITAIDKYKFKFYASHLEQMGLIFCSDLDGYDNNLDHAGV